MNETELELCGIDECRLLKGHSGDHNNYPTSAWSFMDTKDKNKLVKAGFATPRGGSKGAYQNHVLRNNRVIIPYEKLEVVTLTNYRDGYVVRLFPGQYFESAGVPKAEFKEEDAEIVVGKNAFILYRTYESLRRLPPLKEWVKCGLEKEGKEANRRGKEVKDTGHYVLRIPSLGLKKGVDEGPPQGLFAPEYSDENTNYLCKCVLAWLIVNTKNSPYQTSQAQHLRTVLRKANLLDLASYEYKGTVKQGVTCCPLCTRNISYNELHEMVEFEDAAALTNAAMQIAGATRSTVVNLFHIEPLTYKSVNHVPQNVGWGHALCNTRLGQRRCWSMAKLKEKDLKVDIKNQQETELLGWISEDHSLIRGENGKVWVRVSDETGEDGL